MTGFKKLSATTQVGSFEGTDKMVMIREGSPNKSNIIATLSAFISYLATQLPSGATELGKIITVDPVTPDDTTGARGLVNRPFKTYTGALSVFTSGDFIYFMPGVHSTEENLVQVGNSINLVLPRGASLHLVSETDAQITDYGTLSFLNVYGQGAIYHNVADIPTFDILNPDSVFYFECDGLECQGDNNVHCPSTLKIETLAMNLSSPDMGAFRSNLSSGGTLLFDIGVFSLTGEDPGALDLFDFDGDSSSAPCTLKFKRMSFSEEISSGVGMNFVTAPDPDFWTLVLEDTNISTYSGHLFTAGVNTNVVLFGTNYSTRDIDVGVYTVDFYGFGKFITNEGARNYDTLLNTPLKVIGTNYRGDQITTDVSLYSFPRWVRFTVDKVSLSGHAVAVYSVPVIPLEAGYILHAVKIKHSAPFTGGSLSAMTAELGIAGNLSKYSSAFDVFQAAGATVMQLSSSLFTENHSSDTDMYLTFRSTGDNVEAASSGALEVWVLVSKP